MDPSDAPPEPRTYRPLVPLGADREEVLNAVVDGWCTPVGEHLMNDELILAVGTLVGVSFHDANRDEPIDLGELIRRVEDRLGPAERGEVGRSDLAIRLLECEITVCRSAHLVIRPRFLAPWTRFKGSTSFIGTSFQEEAFFRRAEFGNVARFDGAKFGDKVDFSGVEFGEMALFVRAKFGEGTNFLAAVFGDRAGFYKAAFGDCACFNRAKFGSAAGFDEAAFGYGADFTRAAFGDGAHFDGAKFGDQSTFSEANLNDADFSRVNGRPLVLRGLRFGRGESKGPAWWRGILQWFDWGIVRSLGNLQILTRASYLTLILVPLLAGMWPGVRIAVNRLNQSVERAAEDVRDATEQLRRKIVEATPSIQRQVPSGAEPDSPSVDGLPLPVLFRIVEQLGKERQRLVEVLEGVRVKAEKARARFGPEMFKAPLLPMSWVLAFFAALAVTVGHLLYQTVAPQLVRDKSRDGLAAERRDAFGDDRPDRDDHLLRAFDALKGVARRVPGRHRNFVRRHGRVVWLPSDLELFTFPPSSEEAEAVPTSPPQPPRLDGELMRVVIDEGAKAEYDLAAHNQMGLARVAGGFYAVGLTLILWILVHQAGVILAAANWWGTPSIWVSLLIVSSLIAVVGYLGARAARRGVSQAG